MPAGVDRSPRWLDITLEPEHAERLARLARLASVPESTLAGLMLSKAIDEADPDATGITAILDAIPGAYERAMDGLEQAREGEAIGLDDL
jgi:hypothetical protein